MARMTIEQLARDLVADGHLYPGSNLIEHREWGLAVLEAFDHAVENSVIIEAQLRTQARRLLVDVPDAPDYADDIAAAIARMEQHSAA